MRSIAAVRTKRFEGKLDDDVEARCLGGQKAVAQMHTPWVDWQNYWGTADARSKSRLHLRNKNGINHALANLEYQRMELIKFNLFDNKTFQQYVTGDGEVDGSVLKTWNEMRLPADHPSIGAVEIAADGSQLCKGEAIRHRTLSGICNDIRNPAMGSTGQLFARNVEFESTFPDLQRDLLAKNRHGDRLSLLKPDPQVISRKLFTRDQKNARDCNQGHGAGELAEADCPYKKAPFFNVLAAYWIQFMTHDWFSHLNEARNDRGRMLESLGCLSERIDNQERPVSAERAAELGCRQNDKMEAALIAEDAPPGRFTAKQGDEEVERLQRAHKTTRNTVTAWWDASQIYGYDERSQRRVKRDPADPAKLQVRAARSDTGDRSAYLPVFQQGDPIQPEWAGQETAAFPDNWTIGLSFFHNLFVREHNNFIDAFRKVQQDRPNDDSGLRNPDNPDALIAYAQVSHEELYQVARLVISAEIAKIHTIEWTTQLLYDEPLYIGMNSNWSGLFKNNELAARVLWRILDKLKESDVAKKQNQIFSALAAGPGIVGLGANKDAWSVANPDHVNGGTNHFGSPFNFPEEFPTVYRLHPLVPDLLELRHVDDPNAIANKIPVIDTFRGKATAKMEKEGLANWALTMGRQRLGLLALRNHPQFLQNLDLPPRLDSKIDVAALDLIRDRERGVPRFNEFRRQIGLRQLTSFDDFLDRRPNVKPEELAEQQDLVKTLREVYGQHRCDASKIITTAQREEDGSPINDCLGQDGGSMVDNIEDVDVVVGFLAETTHPHGFAISETQFQIFIVNASRRLFSDRFFTSSFRPEFYTQFGLEWVMNSGPAKEVEPGAPNGHEDQDVAPLKRVLLRAMPELAGELKHVVNSFDPWARDRGEYYSLEWTPRGDAAADPAFAER
ncbi:MAG: peroxidase family protein [Xanthobacteraceae bacterium]